MHTALIGLFDAYEQAEAAVRDLEIAGIVGEEVEVISDVDRDARAEALGVRSRDSLRQRISHALRGFHKASEREVHDDPGEMPNYIGEQEFYATHVRKEGAIVVVRVPSNNLAVVAEAILNKHGAKKRDGQEGVMIHQEDDRPEPLSSKH
jgi:hypothetical protein